MAFFVFIALCFCTSCKRAIITCHQGLSQRTLMYTPGKFAVLNALEEV